LFCDSFFGKVNSQVVTIQSKPNDSRDHSPDAHCNESKAKQQGCFVAPQSFLAFRHHIVIKKGGKNNE